MGSTGCCNSFKGDVCSGFCCTWNCDNITFILLHRHTFFYLRLPQSTNISLSSRLPLSSSISLSLRPPVSPPPSPSLNPSISKLRSFPLSLYFSPHLSILLHFYTESLDGWIDGGMEKGVINRGRFQVTDTDFTGFGENSQRSSKYSHISHTSLSGLEYYPIPPSLSLAPPFSASYCLLCRSPVSVQ